jgi:hypothetical protein
LQTSQNVVRPFQASVSLINLDGPGFESGMFRDRADAVKPMAVFR